ncbi:hypothetical protein EIN_429880 [Entamoeba invadens IP1]|uniref:PRA1 family protein n=1 Tax=Entamoeba invadens IP1 TaxID=370355 RepID=A0A0A1UHF1_ENTIV|nr:hypothetical protein EIN_429880 [Entamoeba invadens IP1]ELP95212.1 hypothetical protein EIN_429880 [Entamoeba invadens IP1]|eukprot:XP_004261983.1 hypothetical protein EIN_429880 [Entamoeba invadens IP1]
MEKVNQIFDYAQTHFKEEFELLMKTKYGLFSDVAVMNLRFKINVNNFKCTYVSLILLIMVLFILLKPFLLVVYGVMTIPVIVYFIGKNYTSFSINLPKEYPPLLIALTMGYFFAMITSYLNECMLFFVIPMVIGVTIIRAHSCFAITDAEAEYHNEHCECTSADPSATPCHCCEKKKEENAEEKTEEKTVETKEAKTE